MVNETAKVFNRLRDREMVRQAFLINSHDTELDTVSLGKISTALYKFTDSSLGGNMVINPPSAFTISADIPETVGPNEINNVDIAGTQGMYYSEAIDDTSQRIYLRFGVPQFNSLTRFFTGFYDADAGRLANTGRGDSFFMKVGMVVGAVCNVVAFPLIAANMLMGAINFLQNKPRSKYYYLKPTMLLYWNAVNVMLNHLMVNRGLIKQPTSNSITDTGKAGELNSAKNIFVNKLQGGVGLNGEPINQQDVADEINNTKFNWDMGYDNVNADTDTALRMLLNKLMPDVFDTNGQINIYSVASRGQRKYHKFLKEVGVNNNIYDVFIAPSHDKIKQAVFDLNKKVTSKADNDKINFNDRLEHYLKTGGNFRRNTNNENKEVKLNKSEQDAAKEQKDNTFESIYGTTPPNEEQTGNSTVEKDGFFSHLYASLNDGTEFVGFRVDYTGSVSESFSNSTGESEIASKINNSARSGRSAMFNVAGGNIMGDDTVVGAAVNGLLRAATDVMSGVTSITGLSGLAVLAGSGFADIPEVWTSSVSRLPTANYSIDLVSPYGNVVSQFINIYVPLACLLAGALPRSTGKQSYTSPFLCELYDQGRMQSRLAIIDSITITRGTSNLGFNKDHVPLAIKVTIGVKDLSTVMHMPISESFNLFKTALTTGSLTVGGVMWGGAIGGMLGAGAGVAAAADAFDEDTVWSDYLAVLAGMSLSSQVYQIPKLKLRLATARANLNTYFSSSHAAIYTRDTMPARIISGILPGMVNAKK